MDDIYIEPNFFLLHMQNREGTTVRLRNTLCPPYRQPLLPFGGKSSTVHRLLQPLKVAHTLMVKEIDAILKNPPDGYYGFQELYSVETLYGYWDERTEIAQAYLNKDTHTHKARHPFLVGGFFLNSAHSYLNFSFDLTPFYKDSPDYAGYKNHALDKKFFHSLKMAADFYNEYVERLFDKGFIIIPADFFRELRPHPSGALHPLIEKSILDI